jgi:hypothetical protein
MQAIFERLNRMESLLAALVDRQTVREHYSTAEFAKAVGKAEFTVREWARLGRINAEKQESGRGLHASYVFSHQELLRYQREGLLKPRRWA